MTMACSYYYVFAPMVFDMELVLFNVSSWLREARATIIQ